MGHGVAFTRARTGLEAPLVRAEAQVDGGLPAFGIVGLPETAVRESRERVRGALRNSGFDFPTGRITVNLAPADLPKTGSRFDLAIALSLLQATGQLPATALEGVECLGELSLTGDLRGVRGVLGAAVAAAEADRDLLVPEENLTEALLPERGRIFSGVHLLQITAHLNGTRRLEVARGRPAAPTGPRSGDALDRILGQDEAKRALLIAAAGRHNLLFRGPPGTGKTLLARSLPSLLPALTREEAMEVAAIGALTGAQPWRHGFARPFRAPHHSASSAALAGGGSDPLPGEVSLAHQGVLFLDEIPEFGRMALEVLREPLETGEIAISRARGRVVYPARFQLVAAMNPCPAGRECRGGSTCVCPPDAARRYRARLSGPLMDRIDLHVSVPSVPPAVLRAAFENVSDEGEAPRRTRSKAPADPARRVAHARTRALSRQGVPNADLSIRATERHCAPDSEGLAMLERASTRLGLSARSWHRCLRVARTIADLDDAADVSRTHVAEALAYRPQTSET